MAQADGFVDVAIGMTGSVTVLLGNGDGTFGNPIVIRFVGQDDIFGLVAGDFNNDSVLDLAASSAESDSVFIVLGNGDGTFKDPVAHPFAGAPLNLVAGDFNGDGILDLVGSHPSTPSSDKLILSILIGKGDGTFQPPRDFGPETFFSPHILAVADFDNNGALDLVFGNAVLLGNGDGTFSDPIQFADSGGVLTVGDFDADGKADIAIIHFTKNEVSILMGNGNGTFQPSIIVPVGEQPRSIASGRTASPNHDEIVVGNFKSNTVSVLSLHF